ncbi:MAG: hypothetical protein CL677_01755 [Bdellovibrionaceae bacterium]|nr:hypothetical protein [Pseudobdellovibrionaceae bacterium]|tara:strand:+ start:4540 stop:4926 length:387 start_codon:yes stop_codon:yes gene_type:complete
MQQEEIRSEVYNQATCEIQLLDDQPWKNKSVTSSGQIPRNIKTYEFSSNRYWILLSAVSVNAVFAASVFNSGSIANFDYQLDKKIRAHISLLGQNATQKVEKAKAFDFLKELQKREELILGPDQELAQ